MVNRKKPEPEPQFVISPPVPAPKSNLIKAPWLLAPAPNTGKNRAASCGAKKLKDIHRCGCVQKWMRGRESWPSEVHLQLLFLRRTRPDCTTHIQYTHTSCPTTLTVYMYMLFISTAFKFLVYISIILILFTLKHLIITRTTSFIEEKYRREKCFLENHKFIHRKKIHQNTWNFNRFSSRLTRQDR